MRLPRLLMAAVAGALVVGACSADRSESDSTGDQLEGLIAIGGGEGLILVDPTGKPVATLVDDAIVVSQPTWSRSGDRVVGTSIGVDGSVSTVSSNRDGGEFASADTRRRYFFYSWSGDGSHVAALGGGILGTSLDVLDAEGVPVSELSRDAGTFYLAWEPGGDDLLIHTDDDLSLITDLTDLRSSEPLGSPGVGFLAPAWIPGTRDALIVVSNSDGGRLVRIDVDSGDATDLGPVEQVTGIMVAPNGKQALLAHTGDPDAGTTFASLRAEAAPVIDVAAATELVDLSTGERTVVSQSLSVWVEWSADGSQLLLLQPSGSELEWFVWSDQRLDGLGPFLPSPAFFQRYVFFAWQYVESPRLWSPDGKAIVYAALEGSESGIYVHRIGEPEPSRIADGDVGFWSPG